jgi:hypothetical protein
MSAIEANADSLRSDALVLIIGGADNNVCVEKAGCEISQFSYLGL